MKRPEGLKNITDFAVWRFADRSEKEMVWDTKFGFGFPGWHIECSAMSTKYLGQPFDIHCGGVDHIAVHHTNEIAQSTAATGKKLANYWFHGFFLLVNNQKMAKSVGNVYLLDDIVKKGYSEMGFRYLVIGVALQKGHELHLGGAWRSRKFTQKDIPRLQRSCTSPQLQARKGTAGLRAKIARMEKEFMASMNDDMDTPNALSQTSTRS